MKDKITDYYQKTVKDLLIRDIEKIDESLLEIRKKILDSSTSEEERTLLLQKVPSLRKKRYENEIQLERLYFENMPPFNGDLAKIPSLPKWEKNDYDSIVVTNLIRCGAIPKIELEVGKTYIGKCRNAHEAVWEGTEFVYQREKFGMVYPEKINHFEDDNGYDLFVPIKLKDE